MRTLTGNQEEKCVESEENMFTLIKFIVGAATLALLLVPALRGTRQAEKTDVVVNPSPLPITRQSVQTPLPLQDLEKIEVNGWAPQIDKGDRGMERVEQAIDPGNPSNHALRVFCSLAVNREEKGEVLCPLYPEGGQRIPLTANLQGATIRYRVFVSAGGLGSRDAPNGFQLILKSRPGTKNYYSPWMEIPEEQRWFWVSATPPAGDWVDPDFDLSRVFSVGVKMGLSGDAVGGFRGEVLIDDFEIRGSDARLLAKWDFEPKQCQGY